MVTSTLSKGSIGFYEAGWGKTIASENIKQFIGPKGRIKIIFQSDRKDDREEGDLIELFLNENNLYKQINIKSIYKPMYQQLKHLIKIIESDIDQSSYFDNINQLYNMIFDIDYNIRLDISFNKSNIKHI